MPRLLLLSSIWCVGCGPAALPPVLRSPEPERVQAKADDPLPADLSTRQTGEDWPCFLGPHADSTSREKGILTPWPASGPKLLWYKDIGIGYAMPVISRGRLFLFDRIRNRARLRAWNAESAESLWSFEYPTGYRDMYGYNGGPRCCPVVDGNRVYIFGPEGMLHCVRATDGKLIWKVDTQQEFGVIQNFFGVGSTPVVEGDLLLVQVGGSPTDSQNVPFEDLKPNGSALVAFDKFTGAIKYKSGNELASYASPVVKPVGKQRQVLLFARGGLLSLEPSSGKVLFHFPWRARLLESVNASNPVVVGNRIFLSECYELGSALLEVHNSSEVKVLWSDRDKAGRSKSMLTHWMTPIHVDGFVYGSSGRHTGDAELRCLELNTGKILWRERGLTRCSLLLVDGHFICLGEDGWLRLLAVDPKRYREISKVQLKDEEGRPLLEYPCWAAPILSRGLLYVRGDRKLVCLELIPSKKGG